jgi:hypothetical protein
MSDTTNSLWSGSIDPSSSSPAKTMLKHQAVNLGIITRNVVEADINSRISVDNTDGFMDAPKIIHSFDIIAPLLGYQRFTLFNVSQVVGIDFPIEFYSKYVSGIKHPICHSLQEFNENLQQILSSQDTADLVNSIIKQSK